jgi:hypothetical protein
MMAATVGNNEHQVRCHLHARPLVYYLFESQKLSARVWLLRLTYTFYRIKTSLVGSHSRLYVTQLAALCCKIGEWKLM